MEMMQTVRLPRAIVNQLLRHAQQSPDAEVCGLIGAKEHIPMSCYPVANVAAAPRKLFAMDPAGQIAAVRDMRERGEQLFAIYHSHPAGPPLPSAADLAQANYPEALYLIISLQTRGVLEMQGFFLRDNTVMKVPLEIIE
jgi:proteasome lid subunit RPN8/RPN11